MPGHQHSSMPSRAAVNVWPDFGHIIGVGKNTAYALAKSGRLRVVRVGNRILVPVKAIEEFLETDSTEARQPA